MLFRIRRLDFPAHEPLIIRNTVSLQQETATQKISRHGGWPPVIPLRMMRQFRNGILNLIFAERHQASQERELILFKRDKIGRNLAGFHEPD
ncbi:MAG TPA: hypothetical protein PKW21_02410, partial [Rhabdaerophilum sp.]|nr:hypothetical protein [Rhabdaerophilum sp.]